jgi:DNA invertase Pin-like site-specific DNA recombinase
MRAAIYVRAAEAPDQVDNRISDLRDIAADRWRSVAVIHFDRSIGGTKGRNRLPGLSALLASIARHEVDVVMVWSLQHLGVSVDTLLDTLTEFHRRGVKVVIHDHADDRAAGETGGLLAAADLLVNARRRFRAEAIRVGQIRAKAAGVRFGRPPLSASRMEKARFALQSGKGIRESGRIGGISPAKVSRMRAEMIAA